MKQSKLKLFRIDIKYIRDLAKVDDNVPSVSPQLHKKDRPFVGIIVICGNKEYCVPLSSPKPKHKSMKNDLDFSKIIYRGRLIGVLNFNNMVPVNHLVVYPINLKFNPKDTSEERHYKELMIDQLTYCQQNQEAIIKKANKLYSMIASGKANGLLKKRCCDFIKLEEILKKKFQV